MAWPTNYAPFDNNHAPILVGLNATNSALGSVPVAVDPATGAILTETSSGGTDSVNLTEVGGSAIALGQTTMSASLPVVIASNQSSISIGASTATGSTAPVTALECGSIAAIALPTAVSAGQLVGTMSDKFGRQITLLNAQRDLVLPMTQLTLTASTSETTLIGQVASTYLDIVSLIVTNTSATATQVDFRDSTSGTVRLSLYVPGGDMRGVALPTPMPQNTINNNWTAKCGTSVSSIIITGSYITNK